MLTVHLHQMIFHAHHGLYDGELLTGNTFEVSLDVTYEVKKLKMDNINHLISYEDLFYIVKKRMNSPTPLLEELGESIIRKIKHKYANVKEVNITIYKISAPISGFQGKAGITLSKKYED